MTLPLTGRTIALAEGRQLEEFAQMLEKDGARTLSCPLIGMLDSPDEPAVQAWLRDLIAGRFDLLVLTTGEGVRRLLSFAERAGAKEEFIAALGRTRMIARGPKPGRALKEIGLIPSVVSSVPTTEGVIATLRAEVLAGKTVAVQLFGAPNPALEQFLTEANAIVAAVMPYIYAPSADADRVVRLLAQLAAGEVHAIVFTSTPQVDRLYEVAAERNLEVDLTRTRVAAIGPVVADSLRRRGAPVHICPEQGFVMKNLVKHLREALVSAP